MMGGYGYEGLTIDDFIASLKSDGITILVDVRRNPISRKPGFSKTKLSAKCRKNDIDYVHLPKLGIASEDRKGITDPLVRQKVLKDYDAKLRKNSSYDTVKDLNMLDDWLYLMDEVDKPSANIAVMCFEKDECDCHRQSIVNLITEIKRNK